MKLHVLGIDLGKTVFHLVGLDSTGKVVIRNEVNQRLMARLLETRGHTVMLAQNGREAVEILEKQPFDVVLMDIQMPEMDGFEATTLIREREKGSGRHMLIIAWTAFAMRGGEERCLASGMDGYVSKPIKLEELFSVIANVLPATKHDADLNGLDPRGTEKKP